MSDLPRCAGILFLSGDKVLLLKRTKEGLWDLPGGHLDGNETAEEGAIRETREEIGVTWTGELTLISRALNEEVEYSTFLAKVPDEFVPILKLDEHTDYMWTGTKHLPENTHKYLRAFLEVLDLQKEDEEAKKEKREEAKNDSDGDEVTELDIAKKIRDGELTSPQQFGNLYLFALRISGTGVSFRRKDNEFVYRNPEFYVSDEFMQRANGLPVVWQHPPGQMLNDQEFVDRIIGTIMLPYLNEEENAPWGIARIYDPQAAEMMIQNKLSTSPGVVWKNKLANDTINLDDGYAMMIEGKPSLLDHLAIVEHGVWDKGGEPSGVQVEMTETSRADSADLQGSLKGEVTMAKDNDVMHASEVEKPASTPAEGAKDSDGMPELAAMVKEILGRLEKLETGEAKEEKKIPGIHDGEMPGEPLPTPGQPAPTAADKEENEMAPADLKARIDALEQAMPKPVSDEDEGKLAKAQAKADEAYMAWGKSAPRPLAGESLRNYKIRLLKPLQQHSSVYKDVKLESIGDKNAFKIAEKQILAHAKDAAYAPESVGKGQLRMVKKDYGTGRDIIEWVGSFDAAFGDFKAPKYYLKQINKAA